jgi:hypothetical protein
MRKLFAFSVICFLSAAMLIGCQRDRGVEAGNDDYQPRPAPNGEPSIVTPPSGTQSGTQPGLESRNQSGSQSQWGNNQNQEIRGELTRVDMAKKTLTVRVENGMEQTFKWNDQTSVQGAESRNDSQKPSASGNQMSSLKGKEGSGVTVMWRDDNGAKTATMIHITQTGANSTKGTTSDSKTGNTKGGAKGTY